MEYLQDSFQKSVFASQQWNMDWQNWEEIQRKFPDFFPTKSSVTRYIDSSVHSQFLRTNFNGLHAVGSILTRKTALPKKQLTAKISPFSSFLCISIPSTVEPEQYSKDIHRILLKKSRSTSWEGADMVYTGKTEMYVAFNFVNGELNISHIVDHLNDTIVRSEIPHLTIQGAVHAVLMPEFDIFTTLYTITGESTLEFETISVSFEFLKDKKCIELCASHSFLVFVLLKILYIEFDQDEASRTRFNGKRYMNKNALDGWDTLILTPFLNKDKFEFPKKMRDYITIIDKEFKNRTEQKRQESILDELLGKHCGSEMSIEDWEKYVGDIQSENPVEKKQKKKKKKKKADTCEGENEKSEKQTHILQHEESHKEQDRQYIERLELAKEKAIQSEIAEGIARQESAAFAQMLREIEKEEEPHALSSCEKQQTIVPEHIFETYAHFPNTIAKLNGPGKLTNVSIPTDTQEWFGAVKALATSAQNQALLSKHIETYTQHKEAVTEVYTHWRNRVHSALELITSYTETMQVLKEKIRLYEHLQIKFNFEQVLHNIHTKLQEIDEDMAKLK